MADSRSTTSVQKKEVLIFSILLSIASNNITFFTFLSFWFLEMFQIYEGHSTRWE